MPAQTAVTSAWARLPWALRVAVAPWIVARVVVLAALAVARQLVDSGHPAAAVVARVHAGLLGWDAGWYEAITRHGYGGAGHQSLRFFPLVPLLARALTGGTGVGAGVAVVAVSNAAALAAAALLAALARAETGDEAFGRRAAWMVCLAPPAFTFVMGYAESTFVALAVATVFALRRRRWWWAGSLGFLAALARPLGVFLALAALAEVVRSQRGAPARSRRQLLGHAGAVLGPLAGCGGFLAFVGVRYGDALAPLRIQEEGGLRGRFADPVRTLAHDARLLVQGHHLGTAVHLPWVALALVLLVVVFRRLPAAYGVFAAAVFVAAVTASNLDGFERYALSAFPLVLAAAALSRSVRVERVVLPMLAAGLALSGLLAFSNVLVP
ncbi:MAG: mannosyltransferase family protein [Acidimicrobiales bacterium]